MPAIVGLFIFAIAAIVIIGTIVTIVRAILGMGGGGGGVRTYSNVGTQLGTDGFWITSCPAQPLSVIHYMYVIDGLRRTGQIAYQPGPDGRQFIYTGSMPSQVVVTQIANPYNDDPVILAPPPIIDVSSSDWSTRHSHSHHSSGFPSAY